MSDDANIRPHTTHHNGCECYDARMAALQARLDEAEKLIELAGHSAKASHLKDNCELCAFLARRP